jgi:hypothetical protein
VIVKNSDSRCRASGEMLCVRSAVVYGEVLSQKSPCLRGFVVTAWAVTYVCEGDVRYESYEYCTI